MFCTNGGDPSRHDDRRPALVKRFRLATRVSQGFALRASRAALAPARGTRHEIAVGTRTERRRRPPPPARFDADGPRLLDLDPAPALLAVHQPRRLGRMRSRGVCHSRGVRCQTEYGSRFAVARSFGVRPRPETRTSAKAAIATTNHVDGAAN